MGYLPLYLYSKHKTVPLECYVNLSYKLFKYLGIPEYKTFHFLECSKVHLL